MKTLLAAIISLFVFPVASALADSQAPDPLFQSDQTLKVTITAPFRTLVHERSTEEYLPGKFLFTEPDGSSRTFDVEIRTRGHFRHETCDFPPLRLNFKKAETEGTLFDQQNKMKLVVHCDDSSRYEQTVLREFLAYRLLNTLTDMSFRVRLLKVRYVDSEGRRDEQTRYAFLLEHKNRLAARLDRKDLELVRTSVRAIQPDQLNLTSLFEFLIGNTDFSPIAGSPDNECCHNYVLFGNAGEPILAIPYDFDQSGIVNAPYAVAPEQFRIRSVRQRVYRGRCVNNAYLEGSMLRFRENRDALYAVISAQVGLDSKVREKIVRYVDDFYKILDDPKRVEKMIIRKCV